MIELIIRFFEFIFRIIYVYVWYVFPVLLLISLICVFLGMAIKVGIKAGFGILILLLTFIIFSYIVYGSDKSISIIKKVCSKISGFFFSGYSILRGSNNSNSNQNINDNNN